MKKTIIFIECIVLVILVAVAAIVTINARSNSGVTYGGCMCSSAYSCVDDGTKKNYQLCYYDDIDENGVQIQKTVYCAKND